ncbi:Calcium ion binding protein [Rhynchospora pubera]|uniref:Calcium ion binding protein n=1 Tax=Rhynchospora pubera TaxID=906938 RepID=A0AAV8FPB7_9POAL|nr:Calcium ion binding protein [Rhynchospora pubera]
MRGASGLFHPLHALKSFFWGKCSKEDQNLEKRLIEAIKQRNKSTGQKTFRSMNSITMRFPQLKEGLRNIKHLFNQYDEDANGTIDHQAMKKCFEKMQIQLSDKDMHSLYRYCDVDGNKGIQYPEFIVLLCLAYLLTTSAVSSIAVLGSEQLRYIFNELFDAFLFLDKDGDGKLKRKDMVLSLNDSYHQEKSPGHVTSRRFKEMDMNKNGQVTLKGFLFCIIKWIGIDSDDDIEQ